MFIIICIRVGLSKERVAKGSRLILPWIRRLLDDWEKLPVAFSVLHLSTQVSASELSAQVYASRDSFAGVVVIEVAAHPVDAVLWNTHTTNWLAKRLDVFLLNTPVTNQLFKRLDVVPRNTPVTNQLFKRLDATCSEILHWRID